MRDRRKRARFLTHASTQDEDAALMEGIGDAIVIVIDNG